MARKTKTWPRYRKKNGRFAKKGSTKKVERARKIKGSGAMKTTSRSYKRRGKR